MMKISNYSEQIKGQKCGFCGTVLNHNNINYYDHGDGWKVEGFKNKQWLYVPCHGCGYDWALQKLGVQRG